MNGIIVLWVAAAGFILLQQFQARPLKPGLLLGIPLALAVIGRGSLAHLDSVEAILFFLLNAGLVAGLGIWRGASVRVWSDAGQAFQQGTVATLGLWLLSLAVRVLLVAAGHLAGISTAESMAELPVLLAITLGAQNLVIWMRSMVPTAGFARL